jgi:murein DD-endopeptidase MepM/ murein hydrolase activator NlpD
VATAARLRLLALVAAALSAAATGCGGSDPSGTGAARTATTARAPEPPLKPHPRVVVALSPGQQPPPGAVTAYGSGEEAETFQAPSDAEVKRELGELHASKLSGSGAYTNPFAQAAGLTRERIDMGVDYGGAGPVLALGDGVVFNVRGPGWPGGIFIGIKLSRGPFAGLPYFVAENVKPRVRVGDRVRAGQVIGVMYSGPAGIETGWAAGQGDQPLAAALGQQNKNGDPGAWTSASGLSFDRLLISTGAPSGIPQGTKVHGKMPAQYP